MIALNSIFSFLKKKIEILLGSLRQNRLLAENFVFGFFTLIIAGVGFLNTKLLSDYFTVTDFGYYQLLLTFLGLTSAFSPAGYDNYLRRSMVQEDFRQFFYYYKVVLPPILGSLIIIAISLYLINPTHAMMLLGAIVVTMFLLFDKLSSVLSAKLQFRRLRYIDLLSRTTFLLLTIATYFSKLSLAQFLFLLVVLHVMNHIVRAGFMYLLLDTNTQPFNQGERKKFNSGAIKNSLVILFSTIAVWLERAILGWLHPAGLAIFAIGFLIPKLVKDNLKSFLTPLFYTWSKQGPEYQFIAVKKHKVKLLLLGCCAALTVSLISYFAIELFFQKYADSIPIAIVFSSSLMPIFLVYAMAHATLMSEHIEVNNRIELASSSLKIILALSLVPYFSVWGAVASVMLSETFRFTYYIVSFNRIFASID